MSPTGLCHLLALDANVAHSTRIEAMQNAQTIAILRQCPDFGMFSHEIIQPLFDHCRLLQINEGHLIWRRGDPAKEVFVPAVGNVVRVGQYHGEGTYINTGINYTGCLIGEVEILGGITHRHNVAEALSDCSIVQISAAAFEQFIYQTPFAKDYWLRIGNIRHSLAIAQLYATSLGSAESRLRAMVAVLIKYQPLWSDGKCKIPIKQEILGQMINLSRQTTNKILGCWEIAGNIEVSHKCVFVLNSAYFLESLK